MTVTPVNYRKQDCRPEALARDVDYALQIVDFYLSKVPGGPAGVRGKRLLELGPGYSLGTAVLLACHGAQVSVADRYLSPWDPEYHALFFATLLERLRRDRETLDPEPIVRLLDASAFAEDTVVGLHLGTEDLDEVEPDSFDVVVSNAVFEHVENVPKAIDILARITSAGGVGVHQVDFRDHRDFTRPLEYLTMSAPDFQTLFTEVHGECGNRWRPGAVELEFNRAGFDVLEFDTNMEADEAYLDDLLPRVHADYAGLNRDSLRSISGCFVVRRRAAANTEYPVESDSPQTLAHSATRYAFCAPWVGGKRVLDVGCGAGLGSRSLLSAGATAVTGLDRRPEALELARESSPGGGQDMYLQHDLDHLLPFPDVSFDVVVALEVLEHVTNQAQLVRELHRLLTPDGLAFISVPNKAFEDFWAELAGERNPYHVHVPGLEEFVELLDAFEWVEFFGQIDVVSSLVLPLDGNEAERITARLEVQAGATISDRGTVTVIARCHRHRPAQLPDTTPTAHAYGNYQDLFGGAIADNQSLARSLEGLLQERFAAANRERWSEVTPAEGEAEAPPADRSAQHDGGRGPSADDGSRS